MAPSTGAMRAVAPADGFRAGLSGFRTDSVRSVESSHVVAASLLRKDGKVRSPGLVSVICGKQIPRCRGERRHRGGTAAGGLHVAGALRRTIAVGHGAPAKCKPN